MSEVENFSVEGPVDEQYVRDYIAWRAADLSFDNVIENIARLRAIQKSPFRSYYDELMKPILDKIQAERWEKYQAWRASEDYQWLRNYYLTNTNGSIEEIEELISPDCRDALNSGRVPRVNYANWLWYMRHYFGSPDHDLGAVLEMGALARKVEAEIKDGQEN